MTGAERIRVVIADDHALYRQSLQLVVSLDGDIEVVALANDGREAIERVLECRPDVLVLDLQMPRLSGLEVIRMIGDRAPGTRILMLTMSEEPAGAVEALLAGAVGYVTKDATAEHVADAIRAVHRGVSQLSPAAGATLLDWLMADADSASGEADGHLDRRILQLLAGGRTPVEAAAALAVPEEELQARIAAVLESLRSASAHR